MGLLSAKKQVPTATDLASHDATAQPPVDAEKASSVEHDAAGGPTQQHHVDPVIEKRVIRKLDLTVTPLVAGLCKYPRLVWHDLVLIMLLSPALVPRSREHWQCEDCRDGKGPGSVLGQVYLASDHLLHRVHPLPIPGKLSTTLVDILAHVARASCGRSCRHTCGHVSLRSRGA